MNQRIVYFLIFIIVFNCLNKNEGLEIPNIDDIASKAVANALKDQNIKADVNDNKISLDLENAVSIDNQVADMVSDKLEDAGTDEDAEQEDATR